MVMPRIVNPTPLARLVRSQDTPPFWKIEVLGAKQFGKLFHPCKWVTVRFCYLPPKHRKINLAGLNTVSKTVGSARVKVRFLSLPPIMLCSTIGQVARLSIWKDGFDSRTELHFKLHSVFVCGSTQHLNITQVERRVQFKVDTIFKHTKLDVLFRETASRRRLR